MFELVDVDPDDFPVSDNDYGDGEPCIVIVVLALIVTGVFIIIKESLE